MMRGFVLVTLLLGTSGAIWWSLRTPDQAGQVSSTSLLHEVARGDLEITLTESGTLLARESRNVIFEAGGEATITWMIPEGDEIVEGQVICQFDTTELTTRIRDIGLEIAGTSAELENARTEKAIQESQNLTDIEKAEIALDKARKELERYREGDGPQERRKLTVEIKDAETTFNKAKKRYEDSHGLLEEGYIRESELLDDQIAYEKALVEKEGAELALQLFETYSWPMAVAEREAAVNEAARGLENTRLRAASTLQQRQVAVTRYETELTHQQTRLEESLSDLSKLTLFAPCPGIVIYGDPGVWWRQGEINVGAAVYSGQTLMTVPDLRVMQVQLQIHEADIEMLRKGQTAKVTFDSYPGLVLDGHVTRIAAIASSGEGRRRRREGPKTFQVEVTLDSNLADRQLKPGISARVVVAIDTLRDVLQIPTQCVFSDAGSNFCYVAGSEGPETRTIEIGPSNDSFVQIRNGLREGERVLLENPHLFQPSEEQEEEGRGEEEEGTRVQP